MFYDQDEYLIRCEWGLEGVKRLASTSDVVVIVDVISFTSCVDVAVSRGAQVYPYRWRDERAVGYAHSLGAILATASRRDPAGFSLSPTSMLRLPPGASVVLPSPNGSTLSLATGSTPTFAGCLRNARAIATAALSLGSRISVIPAGERWEDGSLRPALEDWLGAGAILHHLAKQQPPQTAPWGRSPESAASGRSPEAEAAEAAFLRFRDRLFETLCACGSGKEAIERGSIEDIRLAADLDTSPLAPQLVDRCYRAGG